MSKQLGFLKSFFSLATILILCSSAAAQEPGGSPKYSLNATPKTVTFGYYSADAAPVLRIKSGDSVEIHTLITSDPDQLEKAGVPPDQVEQSLRDIFREVKDRGPRGHVLTGPILIEGAEPGDVLEVRILAVRLAIPYAYNGFWPGFGFLPDEFPYPKIKIIPLDEKRMMARFAPGIEIPLHPFFGSMGVAPPSGRISSNPPWIHAGNLDTRIWSPAQRSTSRSMLPGHCLRPATATPAKATAKSTSPRSRHLSSGHFNSSCGKTSTSVGRALRPRPIL